MKESGLPVGPDKPHGYVPEKVGVIIGSGIGGLGSLEEQHKKALEKGFDRLSPFFILQMIINMAPGLVTIRYGVQGPELVAGVGVLHLRARHRRGVRSRSGWARPTR